MFFLEKWNSPNAGSQKKHVLRPANQTVLLKRKILSTARKRAFHLRVVQQNVIGMGTSDRTIPPPPRQKSVTQWPVNNVKMPCLTQSPPISSPPPTIPLISPLLPNPWNAWNPWKEDDDDDDGCLPPWLKVLNRQRGSYLDGGPNISSRMSLDGRQMQNISVRIQEIPEDVFVNVFLQEIRRYLQCPLEIRCLRNQQHGELLSPTNLYV